MAGRKLAANVYVNGDLHEAGSTPTADVAKQIDNPKAWGQEPDAKDDAAAKSKA